MNFHLQILNYIRGHWRGQHGLGWSFWVNLIALRATLSLTQSVILNGWAQSYDTLQTPLVLAMMLANIAVFIWQVMGVLRACDTWLRERGSVSNTWGAQFGVMLSAMLVMADSWGLWILTVPVEDTAALSRQLIQEQAARFVFVTSDKGREITFTGEIVPGTTKAMAAFLVQSPNAKTLTLTSEGGNIYEARGMAKLVRDNGLNTKATKTCSSACTLVFIAGSKREVAPVARLGFHSYRIDANYGAVFVDVTAEEARDRSSFEAAGVAFWFLERAYGAPADSIWFPSLEELQKAGVVSE